MITMGIDDLIWTIIYTIIYTIISMCMSFKLTEVLNDNDDVWVEKLARHFILWPVECLFILVISIRYYYQDRKKSKK